MGDYGGGLLSQNSLQKVPSVAREYVFVAKKSTKVWLTVAVGVACGRDGWTNENGRNWKYCGWRKPPVLWEALHFFINPCVSLRPHP